MPRILVVADERKVLRSLERGLQAAGDEVATAATGNDGYRLAAAYSFDCIVLNLLLPGEVAREREEVDREFGRVLAVLFGSVSVALALVGGLGYFLARKARAPVDQLCRLTEESRRTACTNASPWSTPGTRWDGWRIRSRE